MTSKAPLFSIVMPTRNRADLLHWALQSALAQDFDDYEIVVINNDCTDNTDEVVEALKTDRVSYYKTGQTLSMPENWEFAWSKARGKYVTYLCDDDALLPNALSFVAQNVLPHQPAVVSWTWALYHHPNWPEADKRNTLDLYWQGDSVEAVPTSRLLDQLYRFNHPAYMPRMLNCCVDRELFEGIRNRVGKLFWPSTPDYSLMSIALHCCPEIWLVHTPLMIVGRAPQSIGAAVLVAPSEASTNFVKEFRTFNFFEGSPITIPVVSNYIVATFILLHKRLQEVGIPTHEIDWDASLIAAAHDLMLLEDRLPGFDTYKAEILAAAENFPSETRQKVQEIIEKRQHTHQQRTWLGRAIGASETLSRVEVAIRFQGNVAYARRTITLERGVVTTGKTLKIYGDEIGVASILEMTKRVNAYRQKYGSLYGKATQSKITAKS